MGALGRHGSRYTQGAAISEMQAVLEQGQGHEQEAIREYVLNVRPSPDVCMSSACAEAEDGCTELHTVAVRENEQYRSRKSLAAKDRSGKEEEEAVFARESRWIRATCIRHNTDPNHSSMSA